MFFKRKKQQEKIRDDELEAKIEALKIDIRKSAKNATLSTKKVNDILYTKSDDIILNLFLATGGDRR